MSPVRRHAPIQRLRSGAQLCAIEDVRITGTRFTAGIVGLPGSGGYSANVRVTGGQFAIWEQDFRPNPSITGLVALNQSVAAILVRVTVWPVSTSPPALPLCRTLSVRARLPTVD